MSKPAKPKGPSAHRKARSVVQQLLRRSQSGRLGSSRASSSMPGRGRTLTPQQIVALLRRGLPIAEMETLQLAMGLPQEAMAPLLGISRATLHRRLLAGKLSPAESDRLLRHARLLGLANAVLESPSDARQWLQARQFGLGGATPLDFADSEAGAREVEQLLLRIEHGVIA